MDYVDEAIKIFLNVVYPLVSLYAWYRVFVHDKKWNRTLYGKDGKQDRLNGRLDELISAKEEIAHRKGVEEGIAIALATKEES